MNTFLSSDDHDNLRALVKWNGETNDLGLHEVVAFLVKECGLPAVLEELELIRKQPESRTQDSP